MRLSERFRRWRAGKGYGVHSPLAFRLVRNVVRPPRDVIYYGEERLELEAPEGTPRSDVRRARLLLRLVAELQPAYVWTSPGLPDIFMEAIRLAGCVVRIFDGRVFPDGLADADMAVVDSIYIKKKDLLRFLKHGRALVGFDVPKRFFAMFGSAMQGGVMLDGSGSLIAVASPGDALHSYDVPRF